MNDTPEWLDELRAALDEQDRGKSFHLATVDADGSPRVRTLICRGVDDGGALTSISDARSAKNAELRTDPRSAAVFWFNKLKLQFRLRGQTAVIAAGEDEEKRLAVWREISGHSRALFFWPPCGEEKVEADGAFVETVKATIDPPDNFELLVLRPIVVDRLDLSGVPHRRRQWAKDQAWRGVDVNP